MSDETTNRFFELAERLAIDARCPHPSSVAGFWDDLLRDAPRDSDGRIPLNYAMHLELALVLRVVTFRLQRVLGKAAIFRSRKKGAAEGIAAPHPVLELLTQHQERLRRVVDELMLRSTHTDPNAPASLHQSMLQVLKETEGVLAEVLEFEKGEGGPLEPNYAAGDSR